MLKLLLDNYKVECINIINSKEKIGILNKFPIYVINLKSDVVRRNYIKLLFEKHKINYNLVIVEKFKYEKPEYFLKYNKTHAFKMGCILSHLWCINNAINNNYENFIVFEDDIIFHKNFENLFVDMLFKLDDIPDLLMLGAIDFKINENITTLNKYENIYYPKKNILGAHANMYKLDFAKDFLNYKLNSPKILEFDFDYFKVNETNNNKFKIGICLPNLVVCELSTTNINHNFSPTSSNGFSCYKRSFPNGFTYLDYEYMIIIFIQFMYDKNVGKINYCNIGEAITDFIKLNNNSHKDLEKWLQNGTYSLEDLLVIIENIKSDKYI
jgi:GR25 family glycosyltransferase involved in LPS biosynthesis